MTFKKLNKTSTFPFNISSCRHSMIISEHLFERTKFNVSTVILFCFISNLFHILVLLLSYLKNSVSYVSDKNTVAHLRFRKIFLFYFKEKIFRYIWRLMKLTLKVVNELSSLEVVNQRTKSLFMKYMHEKMMGCYSSV